MLQEDVVMGSAGSARPADAQSESSEDPDFDLGKCLALHCMCHALRIQLPCRIGAMQWHRFNELDRILELQLT